MSKVMDTSRNAFTEPASDPMSQGAFGKAGQGVGGSFGNANPANTQQTQEGGSAEGQTEEEKNLYEKLGQTTGANVVDAATSKGKLGSLLPDKLEDLNKKVSEGRQARLDKRVDYGAVDPETGELVKSELLTMHAEEESGLMNSENSLISPEAELGKMDDGMGRMDDALFADSQSGSANGGPSSSAMMTMDAAGGLPGGGSPSSPKSKGQTA